MFSAFSEACTRPGPGGATRRTEAPRRPTARQVAAAFALALLTGGAVSAGTGRAAAQEFVPGHDGATASLGGLRVHGDAMVRERGTEKRISAGLYEMAVDNGGSLLTYGIDLRNAAQKDAKYQETPWRGTSLHANRDAGKIRWILQNSYPQVNDLGALAKKAGARNLTEEDAAAGTQVAIWRLSHSAEGADGKGSTEVTAVDPDAEKLADHLQRSARKLAEPNASLRLEGAAVSGRPGDLLGPVTVRTTADSVSVTPPADAAAGGVRIVGKDGKPVTSAGNGSELYVEVPEDAVDGSATLTVQASTTVPVGRAFTAEGRSQTQILAGSSESTVTASATAGWAGAGAAPALTARKECAESGVAITAVNRGDQDFTFGLMGFKYVIPAGKSQQVNIPLQEDQAYDFTVTGPNAQSKRFKGVLDCETQGSAPVGTTTQLVSGPDTASVGGRAVDADLADSGSSNSTPLIAGVAVGLVVLGGAAVFLVRKKKPENAESTEDSGASESAGAPENKETSREPGTPADEDSADNRDN